MKTKVKRLSKRTLAMFLGVLMLITSLGIGSLITVSAANFPTGSRIFLKPNDNWKKDGARFAAYFYNSSGNTWYSMTASATSGYYYVDVPASTTWANVIFCRMNGGTGTNNWDNKWNQTGNLSYSSGKNLYSISANGWDDGTKGTWSTHQETSDASLTASKTSVSTGENVTLTPGISSNTDYNVYKSVSYSISPSSGASISGNTFTATSAGTYTVTATVTYNAKGFTGITKTDEATKQINVVPTAYTVSVSNDGHGSAYIGTSSNPTSGTSVSDITGSHTLYLNATPDSGYQFDKWTVESGSASITSASTAATSVTVSSAATIKASFKEKKYNVTVAVGAGGKFNDNTTANKTVSAGSINAVTLPTVKADTGYTFSGWTKTTNASNLTLANTDSASAATVKATGTGTVTANFTKNKHTVTYTSVSGQYTFSDVKYGTTAITSGTTEVDYGETVSFKLAGVTNGGTRYFPKSVTVTGASNVTYNSSTGDGSFTMPDANVTITPSVTKQYKITIADLPTGINSITVKQTNSSGSNIASETFVDENSKVYVKATPKSGYRVGTYTPTLSSSTFTVTKAQTISVTAVKTYNAKWTKAGEGTAGTVKINGTTISSGTNLAVDSGNAVTFVAADGTNSKFAGWYSDSACTTLLSTEKTYTHTNSISADVSIYAAFNYSNYYFVGSYCLAGWSNSNNMAATDTSQAFTQSTSDPKIYTYTNDFRFKKDGDNSILQYVTVSNGSQAYATASANAASGTAASSLVNMPVDQVGNTNKWCCDESITNDYKKVTFTWNAITKKLSWQITDINYDNYTVLYINNADNTAYSDIYIYVDNNGIGNAFPGTKLSSLPYVTIDGKGYNILLISNNDVPDGKNISYIVNKGSSNEQIEKRDALDEGGQYVITVQKNSADVTQGDASDVLVTYNINLTDETTSTKKTAAATSSAAKIGKGKEVTITTHPASGYAALVSVTNASTSEAVAVTKSDNDFKFTMPSAAVNVNVTYISRNKHTVSLRTNDSELGKIAITAPSGDIYSGDEVSFTLNAASKAMYKDGTLKISYGENSTITPTLSGDTYSFTMPDDDVAIYAQFEEYVGDADFWYDGYQRLAASGDGAEKLSLQTASNLRFSEVMYKGKKYAYVKVTRADSDPNDAHLQEFVVKTSLDAAFGGGSSSTGTCGTFYFLRPNWSTWNQQAPRATFYSTTNGTGSAISGPTNFGLVEDRSNGYMLYKINVPIGTKSLVLDNGMSGNVKKSTVISGTLLTGGGVELTNDAPTAGAFRSGKSDQGVDTSITNSSSSSTSSTGSIWQYSTSSSTDAQSKKYKYIDNDAKYSAMDLDGFSSSSPNGTFADHSQIVAPKSYYVVILYPGEDYGILYDGQTSVSSDDDYRVYATNRLPGEDDPTVNYWAKDGVVRMWNKSTATFGTTTVTATDYVTAGTSHNFNVPSNSTDGKGAWQANEKWLEGTATKGQSITVTTQLTDDAKSKYYVKGYSFNGETPEIYTYKSNGTYSCTYTIPSDFKGNKLEITPIYFLKDDTNTVTFYIDGFNDTVQKAWGNTLYVYPFYQYYVNGSGGTVTPSGGQASNFLAYPGQPVINYGGRRYTQIPLTDDATANGYRVKGVTINNGYWDQVHGDTYGNGDGAAGTDQNDHNMGVDFVNVHRQTYDYDDFYKIYNENGKNGEKNLNSIYFTFKYQTKHQHRDTYTDDENTTVDQNSDNAVALTSSNVSDHTWEVLTNNFKKPIDLFGTKLSDADLITYKDKEMYVISEGYEANNAGKFATEWAIYKRDGNKYTKVTVPGGKTSIVPSVLAITSADRINSTEYPALDGDLATTDYKAIYQALESYRGVPVKICYEEELHGGSKSGGYDPAYRSDGRWTFTRTTDYIKANVKIEYMNEKLGINSYTEDPFVDDSHIGTNTGVSAYFTYNSAESGYTAAMDGKTSISNVAIQDDKFFNFKAETAGSYEFVGWYSVDTNGDYHQVNNDDVAKVTGHSTMSTDSTFVARFKYVANGSLTISHTLASGNAGRGDTYLGVYVNDAQIADETTNTDSVKLDKTYIGSNKTTNTIKVVLRTVANGENTFNKFTAKKTDDNDAITDATGSLFGGNNVTSDKVTTRTFEFTVNDLFTNATQNVLALSYYSALNKPINRYVITYNFQERYGTEKAYTVKGEFTDAELSSYVEGTAQNKSFKNTATEFFSDKAPHESNFQKTLTWTLDSIDDVTKDSTWKQTTEGGVDVYTVNASVNSTQVQNIDRIGIFDVPYDTNGKDSNYTAKKVNDSVVMLASDAHKTFEIATKYGKWFENIDVTNFDKNYVNNDESEKLITAPEVINDGNIPMYFSYWKVSTLTKNSKAGKYITKCFYPRFNYVAYENYYIEAVYSSDSSQAYSNLVADKNLMDASISFLQDSRNQWNDKNSGATDEAEKARDKIYNDFALSFKYQGKKLTDYKGNGTNDVRLGMVIQKLGQVDMSGGDHIGTLDSYEKKYESSVAGTATKLQTALPNSKWTNGVWANVTDASTNNKYASYNHVIAANNENITGVSDFNTELIDNKNRTEYSFFLDNSQGQTADLTAKNKYSNKNYVYRAFSYIMVKVEGTWTVKVSETPAYFCMYDIATSTK